MPFFLLSGGPGIRYPPATLFLDGSRILATVDRWSDRLRCRAAVASVGGKLRLSMDELRLRLGVYTIWALALAGATAHGLGLDLGHVRHGAMVINAALVPLSGSAYRGTVVVLHACGPSDKVEQRDRRIQLDCASNSAPDAREPKAKVPIEGNTAYCRQRVAST
jgi:hypothetical protein